MKERINAVVVPTIEFDESRYSSFGLWLGFRNLMQNGFSLGLRKTIGKITQPINSYSRFPEYYWMDHAIRDFASSMSTREPLRVLDVGSPKCFGLYLAYTLPISIELTDISALNVDEYRTMWKAIEAGAKGTATFALQDARSLEYQANSFDVVYCMSVIEHIEGPDADSEGIRELMRVVRPGGLLLLSIPFGDHYVEQQRAGFARAVQKTQDEKTYFFQRIYDNNKLRDRVIGQLGEAGIKAEWTIWRRSHLSLKILSLMGENTRGLLGFVNPWISRMVNRCSRGIEETVPSAYSAVHSAADICGDVVLAVQKAADRDGTGGVIEGVNVGSRVDGKSNWQGNGGGWAGDPLKEV
jgi:2-polyprenyl-3-methyl-5-hydroxy-6-metoxy-1,4-benzoquinol methylase